MPVFLFRIIRLLIHLAAGFALTPVMRLFPRHGLPERIARWWHGALLSIMNVRVTVRGSPADGPHALVANHVSWLDILVLGSLQPVRFVSKSEVHDWPIAGWLATAAGTFYLKRGAGATRQTVHRLAQYLRDGGSAVIFPEGTSTTGETVRRFHARLFAAPIEAQRPLQPVALCYGLGQNGRRIAPFVGDDDLFSHLLRLLREPQLAVEVTFCAPLSTDGHDRGGLAAAAEATIRAVVEPASGLVPAEPEYEPLPLPHF